MYCTVYRPAYRTVYHHVPPYMYLTLTRPSPVVPTRFKSVGPSVVGEQRVGQREPASLHGHRSPPHPACPHSWDPELPSSTESCTSHHQRERRSGMILGRKPASQPASLLPPAPHHPPPRTTTAWKPKKSHLSRLLAHPGQWDSGPLQALLVRRKGHHQYRLIHGSPLLGEDLQYNSNAVNKAQPHAHRSTHSRMHTEGQKPSRT